MVVPADVANATGDQILERGVRCFRVDGEPGDLAIVNLTPVAASGRGWGVLRPDGTPRATIAASVNYRPGSVDPNVGMSEVGADGRVCFHNAPSARVHLVADQLGSIAADVFTPASADTARRILDTRDSTIVGPGERVCATAVGAPGDVALVNITPVEATGSGNGLLVASDVVSPPVAASVNYGPGTVNPNVSATEIGTDGQVCFVNAPTASVHVVMDQIGAVDATAFAMAGTGGAPERVLDTRETAIVGPGGRACTPVAGDPYDVAMVNITPVEATGRGNGLLVASFVDDPPLAANVNYSVGSIDPNVALAPIGNDGEVCFVNADLASVHVVLDHIGTIDADHFDWWGIASPVRVLDTRTDFPTFPPPADSLTQGGTTWVVVLAGSDTFGDPVLDQAVADARRFGYATGPTDCDVGAAEAIGLTAGALTVSVSFESEADARLARAAFTLQGVPGTVVAQVQTFCLD